MQSRNYFSALDDSGDEADETKVRSSKTDEPKPPAVESKNQSTSNRKDTIPTSTAVAATATGDDKEHRRTGHKDDRNTRSGRGRPPVREGKRQYDRRSGTGRGREIKKDGGGSRNWGNEKSVAKEAEGAIQEDEVRAEGEELAKAETEAFSTEGGTEEAATDSADAQKIAEPEKEEETTRTLEEYLQSKLKMENELLKPKAARSVESTEFAAVAPKVTVEENFLMMGAGVKNTRKKESAKEKDEKVKLDLGFRLGGHRRDGDRYEGRGGRSGGGEDRRGGRWEDRRGGRGGRDSRVGDRRGAGRGRGAVPVSVFDPNAFPSL